VGRSSCAARSEGSTRSAAAQGHALASVSHVLPAWHDLPPPHACVPVHATQHVPDGAVQSIAPLQDWVPAQVVLQLAPAHVIVLPHD